MCFITVATLLSYTRELVNVKVTIRAAQLLSM